MAKREQGTALGELMKAEEQRPLTPDPSPTGGRNLGEGKEEPKPGRRFSRAEQMVIAEAAALAAAEPPRYDIERHCINPARPECDGLMQNNGSRLPVVDPGTGERKRIQHIICDECGFTDKIIIPGRYANPPRKRLRRSEIAAAAAEKTAAEMKRRK